MARFKFQEALAEFAISIGVDVQFDSGLDSIDYKVPSVKLMNGQILEADLIIGADGTVQVY